MPAEDRTKKRASVKKARKNIHNFRNFKQI